MYTENVLPFAVKGNICSNKNILFYSQNIAFTKHSLPWTYSLFQSLREKCPFTEFFLVCIFLHSDWIRPNVGKYGPEKAPYLDIFHAVIVQKRWLHSPIMLFLPFLSVSRYIQYGVLAYISYLSATRMRKRLRFCVSIDRWLDWQIL